MSDIGEVFQQMSDATAKDAPMTSREELLDPLRMLLDAARFIERDKPGWAKSARTAVARARDPAQRPVNPGEDVWDRREKVAGIFREYMAGAKSEVLRMLLQDLLHDVDDCLSTAPSTGLPVPAPQAEVRESEWRPIDTKPKDHFPVLVWGPFGHRAAFEDVTWTWFEAGAEEPMDWKPSHWMPLPTRPISTQQDRAGK